MPKGIPGSRTPWHKLDACGICGSKDRYPSRACRPCQKKRNQASAERAKVDPQHMAKLREYAKRGDRKIHGRPTPTHPDPGYCEACGSLTPGGMGGFHEDHDHFTGLFRGWLCMKCNRGIGYLADTIDGVKKALAYLERASIVATSSNQPGDMR